MPDVAPVQVGSPERGLGSARGACHSGRSCEAAADHVAAADRFARKTLAIFMVADALAAAKLGR
jgi:hypothetical protein